MKLPRLLGFGAGGGVGPEGGRVRVWRRWGVLYERWWRRVGDFCKFASLGAVRGASCVRRRYQRQVVVAVVVSERRACNAGLQPDLGCSALLWRWAALSLKLLASTCSSTCILHSIACFKYGVKYNCTYNMPISLSDVWFRIVQTS